MGCPSQTQGLLSSLTDLKPYCIFTPIVCLLWWTSVDEFEKPVGFPHDLVSFHKENTKEFKINFKMSSEWGIHLMFKYHNRIQYWCKGKTVIQISDHIICTGNILYPPYHNCLVSWQTPEKIFAPLSSTSLLWLLFDILCYRSRNNQVSLSFVHSLLFFQGS